MTTTNESKHGYSDAQVRDFAKRFAKSEQARAFPLLTAEVRSALLLVYVAEVAAGNERDVPVIEMFALRNDVARRLREYHKLVVE